MMMITFFSLSMVKILHLSSKKFGSFCLFVCSFIFVKYSHTHCPTARVPHHSTTRVDSVENWKPMPIGGLATAYKCNDVILYQRKIQFFVNRTPHKSCSQQMKGSSAGLEKSVQFSSTACEKVFP